VVRTYFHVAGNQLTMISNPVRDAAGTLFWMCSVLSHELGWFWHQAVHFLLEVARWTRFRLHLNSAQTRLAAFWPESIGGQFLVVLMSPLGAAWWLYDLWKRR
jgi:hypothetical protein